MGVLETQVDPAAALTREICGKFAARQDDLAICAVDPIAIDVDIAERVVRADLLELAKGLAQWAMVPDADVVNRRLILPYPRHIELRIDGVNSHIDLVQTKG